MRDGNAVRLLAALAIIPLSIGAQVSSERSPGSDAHAVTVTFFAEDEDGSPLTNLQLSDLSVRDNGKPPLRLVSLASAKELPLQLGILIDTNPDRGLHQRSATAFQQFEHDWHESVGEAAVDFARQMMTGPEDKAFIATYASIQHGTTFVTRDQLRPIDLNQFLEENAPDFLGFRDAVRVACTKVFGADPATRERRILIVTPWAGGRSLSDYSQTLSAAQRAGVKVFILGGVIFLDRGSMVGRGDVGWGELIGPETGGYWLQTPKPAEWFEHIKTEIDSMYSLTYVPTEPYQSGKLRKLDLKIATNKSWQVYAPKRYLMASAP